MTKEYYGLEEEVYAPPTYKDLEAKVVQLKQDILVQRDTIQDLKATYAGGVYADSEYLRLKAKYNKLQLALEKLGQAVYGMEFAEGNLKDAYRVYLQEIKKYRRIPG